MFQGWYNILIRFQQAHISFYTSAMKYYEQTSLSPFSISCRSIFKNFQTAIQLAFPFFVPPKEYFCCPIHSSLFWSAHGVSLIWSRSSVETLISGCFRFADSWDIAWLLKPSVDWLLKSLSLPSRNWSALYYSISIIFLSEVDENWWFGL